MFCATITSPWYDAAAHVRTRIVATIRVLLENGADPNQGLSCIIDGEEKDFTPLSMLVSENDTDAARLLLEHGADPNFNRTDSEFRLAFVKRAIENVNAEMLDLLLRHNDAVVDDQHGQDSL